MITEIDLLKEDIPRLEMKFGASNPFVAMLKVQLDFLETQSAQQLPRAQDHQRYIIPEKAQLH